MKRSVVALALGAAFTFHVQGAFAADIVDKATESVTFKTFVAAVKASGMSDTLKSSGPYTVFAPSDSAFNKLPPDTMKSLMKDKAKLSELISQHVIPGKITVAEVKPGKVQTIQGDPLTLTSDNGKVTVDGANVTQSDVMADNGVIHEIDTVVLPKK